MKIITALVLILCVCISVIPSAFTEDNNSLLKVIEELREGDNSEYEEIIGGLCEKFNINGNQIAAGYMNLVTGEVHYWNRDRWEVAASMYKVPLTMLVAEKIRTGELDWEKRFPNDSLDSAMEKTLVYSDNNWAERMWNACGCYADYKKGIMPYIGLKKSDIPDGYYLYNKFTPKHFINCLKTLYDNPDRFPNVLELMKKANPGEYFELSEDRFEIAQKYGFVEDGGYYYTNTCGIVFTDEPIALVMFTKSTQNPQALLSAYCTAMCDYTIGKMNDNKNDPQN